jgi:hypothetical protein
MGSGVSPRVMNRDAISCRLALSSFARKLTYYPCLSFLRDQPLRCVTSLPKDFLLEKIVYLSSCHVLEE